MANVFFGALGGPVDERSRLRALSNDPATVGTSSASAGRSALDAYADVPPAPAGGPGVMSPQAGAFPTGPNEAQSQPPTVRTQGGNPPSPPAQAGSQAEAAASPSKKPPMTAEQLVEGIDPIRIDDALHTSLEAVTVTAKKMPTALKQVEAALTLKGMDVKKVFEDMRDNMIDAAAKRASDRKSPVYNEKEFRKRWKNVFNVIPRDQMAMFLMDFGMRMMAASGTGEGNTFSDIGQSGMGALGGVQARQQQGEERALAAEKNASEESRALIEMQQNADTSALNQAKLQQDIDQGKRVDPDKIVWTMDGPKTVGWYDYGDGKGLVPMKGPQGGALERGIKPGSSDGHEYASEITRRNLAAAGYKPKEIEDFLLGAPTEAEIRYKFVEAFDNPAFRSERAVPPGGTERKRMGDFTENERRAWINGRVNDSMGKSNEAAVTPAPKRPEGIDNY